MCAVYNTSAAVVALVRADSEEHAVQRLHAALREWFNSRDAARSVAQSIESESSANPRIG